MLVFIPNNYGCEISSSLQKDTPETRSATERIFCILKGLKQVSGLCQNFSRKYLTGICLVTIASCLKH